MQISKSSIGRRHYRGGLLWWYVGVGVAAQIDNQLALLGFDKERVSLLTYGPTTNLYQSVFIQSKHTFPGGEGAPTTGTLQSSTLTSPALGRIEWTYWIYLPPSYAVSPTRRYPAIPPSICYTEVLEDPVTGFRQRTRQPQLTRS